ncbi:MAG TPA: ATP-binding protein, partial [Phenylobacterium sp.]|nr:ATP-binding protein [Phenylobacterium sp.]
PPSAGSGDFESRIGAAKTAMMIDPHIALQRSVEALAFAKSHADAAQAEHIATAQWLQGVSLVRLNRPAEAEPAIASGLATAAARTPNTKLHGDLTMARAELKAAKGDVQAALEDFRAAYRVFGVAKQPRSQAMALMHIGSIYQDAGDDPKVLEYYAQAADLYPADLSLLIAARNNIGRALKSQKKYAEAAAEFGRAREIARQMRSPQLEASVLTNLAQAEMAWGHLDAAQQHLDEDSRIAASDAGAREEQPFIWGVEAQIALQRHQPKAAAQLLARTFQGVDLKTSPMPFRDFHQAAYETFTRLGDDRQALAHLRAFKRLDDEARQLAASTNAALMSAQFDFANQKTRIAQLKAGELQRDVALAKSRNVVATVFGIGSLIVALLLAVSFLWIRRSRNAVRAANGKLGEANFALEKALKARTEFLATTSHEIRTPLNGILGMTQVMLSERKMDPDLREKISLVHGAGETMRALVDDILDMAKIETDGVTLSRAEFDLPQLCHETTRLWTERAKIKGLTLTLDATEAPARVIEDAGRLRQILFNLMSNAIKFTEAGGVTLTVRVEADEAGEALVLAVADTGIGIPADKLEEVFESFRQVDSSTTRAYAGTGLGLAICRRLAQAMGGDIGLQSVLGEGSTITVRLPLERGAAPAPDGWTERRVAPRTLADCRVMVCDANPMTQAVIKASLQSQVRSVEAVASCEEVREAGADRFDLVLVDASALGAERQARLAALRELSESIEPMLVVVMIADIGEDEGGRLLGAGASQIIKKPIPAAKLAGELQAGYAARAEAWAARRAISAA